MVRTYNRKTVFEITPRKELALLDEKDRTERRRLQKKVWHNLQKAKQPLFKEKVHLKKQPT